MQTDASPRTARTSPDRMPACACDRCERTRVRAHFLGALQQLLLAPRATGDAAASRAVMIHQLVRYAIAGRFPRNEHAPDVMVPVFVDRVGTRCAIAHLMEAAGERAVVEEVARVANYALVDDLVRDERLRSWLHRVGLTASEAARIQPSYCCPGLDPPRDCACDLPGLAALVVGTVVSREDGSGDVIVVDETYGAAQLAVGTEIDTWVETDNWVYLYEGERVLLGLEGSTPHLLYSVDGSMVLTSGCAKGCGPQGPGDVPLDAFIAVAEGASCWGTFAALDGWELEDTDCDGCGIAGSRPDSTTALSWALAAGLALRRRRLGR
jgi:hypothetical protein